jgi:hypothetical protein
LISVQCVIPKDMRQCQLNQKEISNSKYFKKLVLISNIDFLIEANCL